MVNISQVYIHYCRTSRIKTRLSLPALQRAAVAVNISEVFIPYYRSMRPFVELPDGGLLHPMPLIFDSTLGKKPMAVSASGTPPSTGTSWDYPELDNITRPESNTTLAFMTVSSCRAVRHYAGSLPSLCAAALLAVPCGNGFLSFL